MDRNRSIALAFGSQSANWKSVTCIVCAQERSSAINLHIYLTENRERLEVCSVTILMDEFIFSTVDFKRKKRKNECSS